MIDRFFLENVKSAPGALFEPGQRQACLGDMGYFIGIMDEAVEHYYLDVENLRVYQIPEESLMSGNPEAPEYGKKPALEA